MLHQGLHGVAAMWRSLRISMKLPSSSGMKALRSWKMFILAWRFSVSRWGSACIVAHSSYAQRMKLKWRYIVSSLSCLLYLFVNYNIIRAFDYVSCLSEPDDEVSVQLMHRNAMDIHCKLQTWGFTRSWRRRECFFSSPRVTNCCWQMSHVNQVPSLCDFSRCALSWPSLV